MKYSSVRRLLLAMALIIASGCGRDAAPEPSAPAPQPVVYTTFYPMQFFTERITGDAVRVVLPLPPGADPMYWKPSADVVSQLQAADLIIANGAQFEKWLATAVLPESRLVRSAEALGDDLIEHSQAITHTHGPSGEHVHAGVDGHTWLDPVNALLQVQAIRDALIARWPAHAPLFEANHRKLAAELAELDALLKEVSVRTPAPPVFASHPAYGYLARRYGWNLRNLDLDPQSAPDEHQLAAIAALLEKHPAKYVVWESEPRPAVAASLQRLGLRSVVFSPCETLSSERQRAGEDYLSVMRTNIANLQPLFTLAESPEG